MALHSNFLLQYFQGHYFSTYYDDYNIHSFILGWCTYLCGLESFNEGGKVGMNEEGSQGRTRRHQQQTSPHSWVVVQLAISQPNFLPVGTLKELHGIKLGTHATIVLFPSKTIMLGGGLLVKEDPSHSCELQYG